MFFLTFQTKIQKFKLRGIHILNLMNAPLPYKRSVGFVRKHLYMFNTKRVVRYVVGVL